jgi:hypothetical protein
MSKSAETGHNAAKIKAHVGYIVSTKFKPFKAGFCKQFFKSRYISAFREIVKKTLKPHLNRILNTVKGAIKIFLKTVQKHQNSQPCFLKIAHRTHRKHRKKATSLFLFFSFSFFFFFSASQLLSFSASQLLSFFRVFPCILWAKIIRRIKMNKQKSVTSLQKEQSEAAHALNPKTEALNKLYRHAQQLEIICKNTLQDLPGILATLGIQIPKESTFTPKMVKDSSIT